jgi:hypothetical protein
VGGWVGGWETVGVSAMMVVGGGVNAIWDGLSVCRVCGHYHHASPTLPPAKNYVCLYHCRAEACAHGACVATCVHAAQSNKCDAHAAVQTLGVHRHGYTETSVVHEVVLQCCGCAEHVGEVVPWEANVPSTTDADRVLGDDLVCALCAGGWVE